VAVVVDGDDREGVVLLVDVSQVPSLLVCGEVSSGVVEKRALIALSVSSVLKSKSVLASNASKLVDVDAMVSHNGIFPARSCDLEILPVGSSRVPKVESAFSVSVCSPRKMSPRAVLSSSSSKSVNTILNLEDDPLLLSRSVISSPEVDVMVLTLSMDGKESSSSASSSGDNVENISVSIDRLEVPNRVEVILDLLTELRLLQALVELLSEDVVATVDVAEEDFRRPCDRLNLESLVDLDSKPSINGVPLISKDKSSVVRLSSKVDILASRSASSLKVIYILLSFDLVGSESLLSRPVIVSPQVNKVDIAIFLDRNKLLGALSVTLDDVEYSWVSSDSSESESRIKSEVLRSSHQDLVAVAGV